MDKNITLYPDAPDIESSSADYARRFSGEVGRWFLDVQSQFTLQLIRKAGLTMQNLSVLDVGGGHGQNLPLARELGSELTIFASSKDCMKLISDEITAGRVRFVTGSLLNLPFADNSFDIVLCYRVLAHMEKWRPLLKELTRVSSKLVIVDYASSKSVNAVSGMFFSAKKAVESNTRYFQLHRNEDITQEFLRAGALPAGNYGQFFFPMALHRAMKLQALSKIMEGGARVCGLSFFLGSPVLAAFDMEKGKDKQ